MQWLKRLACCVAAALLAISGAQAEVKLLPQLDAWMLAQQPLEITLAADVAVHMPFDDTRAGQLRAMLNHITLRMNHQQLQEESWSRVALEVDGAEAVSMSMREMAAEAQLQLSSQPDRTYVASAGQDPAALLLGESTAVSFAGMDGTELAWLDDAYDLLNGLDVALADYGTEKSVKTAITNMGTARKKITYTIPADDAAKLTELLPGLCVDGALQRLLTGLVYSGKQQFVVYQAENGEILKGTYEGKCGVDTDHLRTVSISWSLKRDDADTRDTFTMKSPAVKGTDRNTITFKRVEKAKADGTVTLEASYKHESVESKVKQTVSAEAELKAAPKASGTQLTGSVSIKLTPAEDDDKQQLILTPTLIFAGEEESPGITGTLTVETRAGASLKRVTEKATLTIDLHRGDYFDWELRESTVDLTALSESQLATVCTAAAGDVATDLIRPLVLLPYEDTLFLSADLDEASWQKIVDAARAALE